MPNSNSNNIAFLNANNAYQLLQTALSETITKGNHITHIALTNTQTPLSNDNINIEQQGVMTYVLESLLPRFDYNETTINQVAEWAYNQDRENKSSRYKYYFLCLLDRSPLKNNIKLNQTNSYNYLSVCKHDVHQLILILNCGQKLNADQARNLLVDFLRENDTELKNSNRKLIECFQLLLCDTHKILSPENCEELLINNVAKPAILGLLQYFLQSQLTDDQRKTINEAIDKQKRSKKYPINASPCLKAPDTNVSNPNSEINYSAKDLNMKITDLYSTMVRCDTHSIQLKYYMMAHLYHLLQHISGPSKRVNVSMANQLIKTTIVNLRFNRPTVKQARQLHDIINEKILPVLKFEQFKSALALSDQEQLKQFVQSDDSRINWLNDIARWTIQNCTDNHDPTGIFSTPKLSILTEHPDTRPISKHIIEACCYQKPGFLKTIMDNIKRLGNDHRYFIRDDCKYKIFKAFLNRDCHRQQLIKQLKPYPRFLPHPMDVDFQLRLFFESDVLLNRVKQGNNDDIAFIGYLLNDKSELPQSYQSALDKLEAGIKRQLTKFITTALQADQNKERYDTTRHLLNCLQALGDSKLQEVAEQFNKDHNPLPLLDYAYTYRVKKGIESMQERKTKKINFNQLMILTLAEFFPNHKLSDIEDSINRCETKPQKIACVDTIDQYAPDRFETDLIQRALSNNDSDIAVLALDHSINKLSEEEIQFLIKYAYQQVTDQTTKSNFLGAFNKHDELFDILSEIVPTKDTSELDAIPNHLQFIKNHGEEVVKHDNTLCEGIGASKTNS